MLIVMIIPALDVAGQILRRNRGCGVRGCRICARGLFHDRIDVIEAIDIGGDTITIQNVYPTAPQGDTIFGYGYDATGGSTALGLYAPNRFLIPFDPNQYLARKERLINRLQDLENQALRNADQLANAALTNDQVIARLQLITELVQATREAAEQQDGNDEQPLERRNIRNSIEIIPDGEGGVQILLDGVDVTDNQPQESNSQAGGASDPGAVASPGLAVFTQSCLPCHGAESESPFVDLNGDLAAVDREKMLKRAFEGSMPPQRDADGNPIPALTAQDYESLKSFLTQ